MPGASRVSNEDLRKVRDAVVSIHGSARAWQIKDELLKTLQVNLDESTIRGRFIEMGEPLSGAVGEPKVVTQEPVIKPAIEITEKEFDVPDDLKVFIPHKEDFDNYIERPVDKRLEIHYRSGKYPLTQGKQGTGKTYSHAYFAHRNQLPFFLFSCYEDFKLAKLFGDKTIVNGSIVFKESLFTRAIQSPSVILFDEINAVSNANSFDFHALLQNRELFVKDADDGNGKVYQLHRDCFIGFAQNPKSAKYIGGNIKPSNFLGRCTYITYPEFDNQQISAALQKKFPVLKRDDLKKFVKFYFACVEAIERSNIPVDISIRQMNNVIDLWLHGMPLQDAIEDGMTSILEAISQPKAKEAFFRLAQAVWKELIPVKEETTKDA